LSGRVEFIPGRIGRLFKAETKFGECEVTSSDSPKVTIAGRPATMLQVVHPVPRQDFKFHVARLFIDNELKIPVHFDAFLWPEQAGGARNETDEMFDPVLGMTLIDRAPARVTASFNVILDL